jgi:hypothetical protein
MKPPLDAKEIVLRYLDRQGRIEVFPASRKRRPVVLAYLADHFEADRIYRETEVNAVIDSLHTFGDIPFLRRALIEEGLLVRTRDCREYRRVA